MRPYGLNYWVSNAAYLGVDQGKVAIYRGVPGEFAGMSFSTLEKTTDINVDDLQRVLPIVWRRTPSPATTSRLQKASSPNMSRKS